MLDEHVIFCILSKKGKVIIPLWEGLSIKVLI
jgi:hypothetical protein